MSEYATQSAGRQRLCDDLRNHLVGAHEVNYRELKRSTWTEMRRLHQKIAPTCEYSQQ